MAHSGDEPKIKTSSGVHNPYASMVEGAVNVVDLFGLPKVSSIKLLECFTVTLKKCRVRVVALQGTTLTIFPTLNGQVAGKLSTDPLTDASAFKMPRRA
ncbi:hypothetical protein NPIL_222591 [Nephila pilipes]|uniref:Uncharacterized protein n=1 Tax=Nephila pilipes TaxID=299642 RepID=A0A8X6P5U2_NEPPI|nr:hypothetical protein NPIL_222591 [Nephila pilipes]